MVYMKRTFREKGKAQQMLGVTVAKGKVPLKRERVVHFGWSTGYAQGNVVIANSF